MLRHHSYIHRGFRGSYPFVVFHGTHNGSNQAVLLVSTSQKYRAGDKLQHRVFQTMKPRMRDKCEPSCSPFCRLGMLVPRVTPTAGPSGTGSCESMGFGSLCVGNPSSSAHSPDRQLLPPHDSTQTDPLQSSWRRMF